jgi:hypothetical protein
MYDSRTDLPEAGYPTARRGIFSQILNVLPALPGRLNSILSRSGGPGLAGAATPTSVENIARQIPDLLEQQRKLQDLLAARHADIAAITNLLHHSELSEAQYRDRAEWLTEVSMVMIDKPAWWSILPLPAQRRAVHRRLRRKKLFDASFYLSRYPDVQKAKMDPLGHYIRHGVFENRGMGLTMPSNGWASLRSRPAA